MKRVLRVLGVTVGGLLILLSITFLSMWFNYKANFLDYPYYISEKEETIELMYVAWACDCAEWATPTDVGLFSDNSGDTLSRLSIFIEAERAELKIPEEYKIGCCGNRIKFTGRFYMDKGIGRDYEVQFEKPNKARVFRYTKYELVKPYTAWDFEAQESAEDKTKTIH